MRNPPCAKCGGGMEEGFLIDSTHNAIRVAHWASGNPEYWFARLMKMRGRRKLPLRTLRCRKCGYLESYAAEPTD